MSGSIATVFMLSGSPRNWGQVTPGTVRVLRTRHRGAQRAERVLPGRGWQTRCQAVARQLGHGLLATQRTDAHPEAHSTPITFAHLTGVVDVEIINSDMAPWNSHNYINALPSLPTCHVDETQGKKNTKARAKRVRSTQKRKAGTKRGPKPSSSNAWNIFQQTMKGSGLSRAEVRDMYKKEQAQPKVTRSRLAWNHFQASLAGRGLSNRRVSELYQSCHGNPVKALMLIPGAEPEHQTVRSNPGPSMVSRVVPFKMKHLKPAVVIPKPLPLGQPAAAQLPQELFSPLSLPNLGYACSNHELRKSNPSVYIMRKPTKHTFEMRGLKHVSALALCNCRDLLRILQWNERAGIRLFRLTLDMLPWCDHYNLTDLPDYTEICEVLASAGAFARERGHRVTAHASHYVKLASPNPELVDKSTKILERHSELFDLMGYSPSLWNKINVHVGGQYGNKNASLRRFTKSLELLSPSCRARLTVENDDSKNGYSVADLLSLFESAGIPIVFDVHHHKFCDGGMSERSALHAAYATWPKSIRPIIHWSESQDGRSASAHSDFIREPIRLHGLDDDVDVMLEAKGHERAVLRCREDAMRLRVSHVLGRVMTH